MNTSQEEVLLHEAMKEEREAHRFLMEQKNEQAFEAYRKAASIYKRLEKHEQAGHCFIKASSCWGKHIGHHPYRKAAESSEMAAREFLKTGNYEASIAGFVDAALFYEKEGDAAHYSACYYDSKRIQGKKQWADFCHSKEPFKSRVKAFLRWFANSHSRMLWGYGEKPFRTLRTAGVLIFLCALVYAVSPVRTPEAVRPISFGESLYFSIVTFSTVGYGDYLPVTHWTRVVASFECLSGIMLTPLFLVALTRRYLRMS